MTALIKVLLLLTVFLTPLIGAPPYSGSGFSLDILNELPAWRKQQLPGYIQDQLK